jgi:hypothetical protein
MKMYILTCKLRKVSAGFSETVNVPLNRAGCNNIVSGDCSFHILSLKTNKLVSFMEYL